MGKRIWAAALVIVLAVSGFYGYRLFSAGKVDWEALRERRETEFRMRVVPSVMESLPLLGHGWLPEPCVQNLIYTGVQAPSAWASGPLVTRNPVQVAGRFRIEAAYSSRAVEPKSLLLVLDVDLKSLSNRPGAAIQADPCEERTREDVSSSAAKTTRIWGYAADLGKIEKGRRRICLRLPWPIPEISEPPSDDRGYADTFYGKDMKKVQWLLRSQVLQKDCEFAIEMPPSNLAPEADQLPIGSSRGWLIKGDQVVGEVVIGLGCGPGGSNPSMALELRGVYQAQKKRSIEDLLTPEVIQWTKTHSFRGGAVPNELVAELIGDQTDLSIDFPLDLKVDGLIKKTPQP